MSKKHTPVVVELQQKIDELTDALQRERADSVNIRRRHEEQIAKLKDTVKAQTVREILPVLDNCERLLQHISSISRTRSWKQGVEQIERQVQKTLDDMGVQRIKALGEVFDPKFHEAISIEESDEVDLSSEASSSAGATKDKSAQVEVVCEELQPGYILGDEVIRHAMVKVRMESAQEQGESSKEEGS